MAHEHIYQRINYLFQAANQSLKSNPNDLSICRFYLHTLKTIARRHVLHLHSDMQRAMCKRCCVLLVPGVTSMVRTRCKKHKKTVITCLGCGTVRRFHSNRNRVQWLEKEESWETVIENGKQLKQQNTRNQESKKKGNKKGNSKEET